MNHDRVNGSLAMSRAFGDFIFKQNEELSSIQQAVTCKYQKHKPYTSRKYRIKYSNKTKIVKTWIEFSNRPLKSGSSNRDYGYCRCH